MMHGSISMLKLNHLPPVDYISVIPTTPRQRKRDKKYLKERKNVEPFMKALSFTSSDLLVLMTLPVDRASFQIKPYPLD